jgi:very-short-patch-repair endonuclease
MDGEKVQSDLQTVRARDLRRNAIPAEIKLWNAFRVTNKTNPKIRRQHPIGHYILDFYCSAAKLCLEIDGASHWGCEQDDFLRDQHLLDLGIETTRVKPTITDSDLPYFVEWFLEECKIRIQPLSS